MISPRSRIRRCRRQKPPYLYRYDQKLPIDRKAGMIMSQHRKHQRIVCGRIKARNRVRKPFPHLLVNKVGSERPLQRGTSTVAEQNQLVSTALLPRTEENPPAFHAARTEVEFRNVSKSKNYPITEVRSRCRTCEQYTFESMLKDLPLTFQHVPRPDVLGVETWLQKRS